MCYKYLLRKAVGEEVPVEVADPLDVDRHHAAAHRQLGVVPAGRLHHVPCSPVLFRLELFLTKAEKSPKEGFLHFSILKRIFLSIE